MLVAVGVVAIWSYNESLKSEVNHVYIKDRSFGNVYGGITIAQISDLHIGRGDKQITRILKILQGLKVDAIVLTGDYVQWSGDYEVALNILAQMKAKNGVYAVMGDYDYSNSRKSCLFCHERKQQNNKAAFREVSQEFM